MKVSQSAAVSLLKELDMVTADKWPLDRLEKKIASLPKLVKQEELEAETKEGKKLLASILKAIEAEEEVKVTAGGTKEKEAAPANTKSSKKSSKKAAKEEEEEGDDEESDDSDDDSEEEDDAEESDDDSDDDEESEDEEEEASDEDDEEAEDDEDEKPAKKKGAKKGTPIKSAGGDGKPGIIASILEFITDASEDAPISKKGILKKLAKRFPDRNQDSMARTINVQVPNRIKNDKGIELGKNDNGYWVKGKIKAKKSKE